MSKTMIATAATVLVSALVLAPAAEARFFSRSVHAGGYNGHGYFRSRTVAREPGSVDVHRNFQTRSGAGMVTDRNASWGNGSYSGGATHTLNNGDTFGRSTSINRNGDGTASYSTTHTGIDGHSTTVTGTISHP